VVTSPLPAVAAAAPSRLDPRTVLAALDEVPDPEIPTVSIVELGMIEAIDVEPSRIRVELLPTFVGCPALEVIRAAVAERLVEFGRPVEVRTSFATPWTTDRISAAGREKLKRSGFAPPPDLGAGRSLPMLVLPLLGDAPVQCPYCGSSRTTLENVFGPTQCRSIRYCAACRQPFEAFKPV
jgi:ring-1,2-phenylacetyl-CoA epoxidase subunit PaaD